MEGREESGDQPESRSVVPPRHAETSLYAGLSIHDTNLYAIQARAPEMSLWNCAVFPCYTVRANRLGLCWGMDAVGEYFPESNQLQTS